MITAVRAQVVLAVERQRGNKRDQHPRNFIVRILYFRHDEYTNGTCNN